MPDTASQKQRKRIAYLEALALKQSAILSSVLRAGGNLPAATARQVKEAIDEAARIHHAQAVRKQSKKGGRNDTRQRVHSGPNTQVEQQPAKAPELGPAQ